jgi:hypothetical protein
VKRRIGGDRRVRGRFEIVGTLSGTLETIQRLGLRNVGPGGALVESTVPLAVGTRVTGRLSLNGQTREIKAEVRHAAQHRVRSGEGRYLVGLEWVDVPMPIDDVLRNLARTGREHPGSVPERRRAGRTPTREGAEIQRATWTTVELIDISTVGVLFVASQEIPLGERGQLRIRLGDSGFVGEIEVRRIDRRASGGYRMGAIFTALDQAQQAILEAFIGTARH